MLRDLAEERVDEEANYWLGEFCRLGMVLSKAEILSRRGCDRHQVKQALEAGCDPELAFDIFS
jgi:hypothetical protein